MRDFLIAVVAICDWQGRPAAGNALCEGAQRLRAKECHVERLLREVTVTRIAPITEQLTMCFIAEKVLELSASY
ncbi:hypothetical protein AZKH_p0340 (plasmid) [Azoarcus sp. KH32C]|nr:hypothetical protein AZKH_p0340 [Azoarcus sp. KH32C]